jgi:membrane protein implicated in regulation of membrane protease activity
MILVGSLLLVAFGMVPAAWGGAFIAAAAVVEVLETTFWIWLSKRRRAAVGVETLVGATARVIRPCRPVGQVRLQGETWRARCEAGADGAETVRVRAVRGLELVVERIAD